MPKLVLRQPKPDGPNKTSKQSVTIYNRNSDISIKTNGSNLQIMTLGKAISKYKKK